MDSDARSGILPMYDPGSVSASRSRSCALARSVSRVVIVVPPVLVRRGVAHQRRPDDIQPVRSRAPVALRWDVSALVHTLGTSHNDLEERVAEQVPGPRGAAAGRAESEIARARDVRLE